ncbi:hypothetical protein D5086_014779 [Populus alba]|uniref:Uncharacterized protein n=1 Tax=Populus alba TaxID=43335 RepID=A0ACC4BYI4_POPAL
MAFQSVSNCGARNKIFRLDLRAPIGLQDHMLAFPTNFSDLISINLGHLINSKLHVNDNLDNPVNATTVSPPAPPAPVVGVPHPSLPGHVDDFRPTAPGHSPGVGHSLQN